MMSVVKYWRSRSIRISTYHRRQYPLNDVKKSVRDPLVKVIDPELRYSTVGFLNHGLTQS